MTARLVADVGNTRIKWGLCLPRGLGWRPSRPMILPHGAANSRNGRSMARSNGPSRA